jgi:hypothetical protein
MKTSVLEVFKGTGTDVALIPNVSLIKLEPAVL